MSHLKNKWSNFEMSHLKNKWSNFEISHLKRNLLSKRSVGTLNAFLFAVSVPTDRLLVNMKTYN